MHRSRLTSPPLLHLRVLIFLAVLAMAELHAAPRIIAPNGGERFRVGSTTTIRWDGVAATDTVTLDYSIDNGVTWNLITNAAVGLSYTWTNVPNTPSDLCLMRISTRAAAGDSVLYLKSTRAGFALPDAVHFAEFSPDGTQVIGGGAEGDVFIWDAVTGQLLFTVPVEQRSNIPSPPAAPGITLIACVHYSPDGRLFVTTGPLPDSSGAMVRVFDAATRVKLREWRTTRGVAAIPSSQRFAFSPDGTRIVVTTVGGGIVYNVADGSEVVRLKGYVVSTGTGSITGSMIDADWSSDGARIVGVTTAGGGGFPDIVVSDAVTGDTIHTFAYPSSGYFDTGRFNPDGTRIITTATNGAARIYDATTGAIIYDIHDYDQYPNAGAFSHSGAFFATAGQDVTMPNWKLRLYDATTGAFIRQVGAIINGMRMLQFSPDDSRILVACIDGVRIFHAPQGTPGLSDVSDSLWSIFTDGSATVNVSAPVLAAREGATVIMPIYIDDAPAALGVGATRIDLTLRFNSTLLEPLGVMPRGTVSAGHRVITLSLPLAAAHDSVLAQFAVRAALGNDSVTALELLSVSTDNPKLTVIPHDGLFRISDICREGGARLLNPDGTVLLKVRGTPVTGAVLEAEIETIEAGRTTLALYDIDGRLVRRFVDDTPPSGRWLLPLDMSAVPQGRYMLVLRTPTVVLSEAVEVVR